MIDNQRLFPQVKVNIKVGFEFIKGSRKNNFPIYRAQV